jgi:hypothetical protein
MVWSNPDTRLPTDSGTQARIFKLKRPDLRVTLAVRGGRIVRVHIRALEYCGGGADGFLGFDLTEDEAIRVRRDGGFRYGAAFDDARGNATLALGGRVHRRSITGFFRFQNREDRSCGTGRPGHRTVRFRAWLRG